MFIHKIINNKITKSLLSFSAVAVLMTSCIEEYNAELPSSESNLLVVEGSILSDTISTFYLSLTAPVNSSSQVNNVQDATIQLRGSDGTVVDATYKNDGKYEIVTPKLDANAKYMIIINYNDDTYESDEQLPFPTLPIQTVEFNQKNDEAAVDIMVTTAPPADPNETQYFRWTYNETWEVHPEYRGYWYWDNNKQRPVYSKNAYPFRGWLNGISRDILASSSAYYGSNQIVKYKLYDVANDDRRLFVEYSTEVTQRSLRKAEYEYESERRKISKDMGGLFTPQPSSLPSNIHCTTSNKNVIGYVGCSLNVARYRLFIFPEEINVLHDVNCGERTSDGENGYANEKILYANGYRLYDYESEPGGGGETFYWANSMCVDIRLLGASLNEPDYWVEK